MTPAEILKVAPEWLVMIVIALAVVSWVGRIASEASESWAKLLGPLGRRWRDRGIARQEARAEARMARMADLEDMTRQRDNLADALSGCRDSQADAWNYITYDADWHRRLRLSAAETGCDLPPHKPFSKWKKMR